MVASVQGHQGGKGEMKGADVCLCHTGFWDPLGVTSLVSTVTGGIGIWIEYLRPSSQFA